MNKTLLIIIGIIILLGGGYFLLNQSSDVVVTNYEECVAAGNPIMESYPERCMHDGKTYIRVITQEFNNNTLGISFNYPVNFGEADFVMALPGKRPGGETGKKLVGTFSGFPDLEFGGITEDFSAGRSGLITDTRGFIEENGIYYFKFVASKNYKDYELLPLKVLEKDFGKILILNDQSFRAEREGADGPVLGVGKGNLAGLVNLKGGEFPGLVFYNRNTEDFSLEDFEALLDSIVIYSPEDSTADTTATSADDAPPGSIHNLPVPDAVSAVKKHVAEKSGVREGLVIVMTAYEKEWSDGCLGLGGPAEGCIAVITPGYEVTVSVNGAEQTYRTNADGSQIRMEE